jgi:Fic family protein
MAFRYRAFIPDTIASARFAFDAAVAERIGRAERAIVDLNHSPPALGLLEVLARRLLRAESVASSRIEGLQLSHRRLARAEVSGDESRDETAKTVLANVAAMELAISLADRRKALSPKDICAVHAALMFGAGISEFRAEQNWIGGNSFNPHGADFVPPPAEHVPKLMADLCDFLNRTDLPPLAQAAIAHAQFETIHPFPDGNGRVGRALIHVVLRRRHIASSYVPPVSLVLAGNSKTYIGGLTLFRGGNEAAWCDFFAEATGTAARKSTQLADTLARLQERWSDRAGHPRTNSSVAALIPLLPAYPILSVATAQRITRRSKQAANEALTVLEEKGILTRVNLGKRNRAWEAKEVFDILNEFERELAMPIESGEKLLGRAPYSGRGHSRAPR